MNQMNDFLNNYIGTDWKDVAVQSMLIGFGIGITIALVTIMICSRI